MLVHDEEANGSPIWAAFGDLMACLFGVFVLFFVWAVVFQVALKDDLKAERARFARENALRKAEGERLKALERSLAGPLAAGRITLSGNRIGIRGSVLFDLNASDLKPDGQAVLSNIAAPLKAFLEGERGAMIMVSGFTDDLPLRSTDSHKDNWQLSSERALTVTRTLIAAGVENNRVFAAGFGDTHPVVPNDTDDHRAKNRRVEIALVPGPLEPTP